MDFRERLQSTLGNTYTVERELGGGGMSRVFLAHETSLGRNVVVKVLHSEMVGDISAERFAREVKLAASLQHPNIVPVLSTGVADGLPWYSMPYVKGESLRARMHELGTLPRRQVISILRDLARALQYAHEEGVVHRDIKPENILLSGDAAVVTDFGIAKAISAARTSAAAGTADASTLTRAGSTIGTPPYMAPEQVAGDPVDRRTDLYAWGLIAYELLASGHPFAAKANISQLLAAQLTEMPEPLSAKVPSIPPSLADLVMRCLAKDPDNRPASAAEVLDGLDITLESRDHPSMTMVKRPRRSNRVFLAAIPVVLIALGAYAYLSNRGAAASDAEKNSVAVLPFADPQADAPGELAAGIYDVSAQVLTASGTTTTNSLPFAIAPNIDTWAPGVLAAGKTQVTVPCSPFVRPGQQVFLIIGNQLAAADPFTAPTNTPSFTYPDLQPTNGLVRARLRVDGIESRIVDRTTTPPTFVGPQVQVV